MIIYSSSQSHMLTFAKNVTQNRRKISMALFFVAPPTLIRVWKKQFKKQNIGKGRSPAMVQHRSVGMR